MGGCPDRVYWFLLRRGLPRELEFATPPGWRTGLAAVGDTCRDFTLALTPRVSGDRGGFGGVFGAYYHDGASARPACTWTLGMLLRGDAYLHDAFRSAAAGVAVAWLRACGGDVFETVCNLGGAGDGGEPYGPGFVRFTGLDLEEDGDEALFRFREVAPGAVTHAFLARLAREVWDGADTWDCGDFGDVTREVAAERGRGLLREAWASGLGPFEADAGGGVGVGGDPAGERPRVRLRVTLCDASARVYLGAPRATDSAAPLVANKPRPSPRPRTPPAAPPPEPRFVARSGPGRRPATPDQRPRPAPPAFAGPPMREWSAGAVAAWVGGLDVSAGWKRGLVRVAADLDLEGDELVDIKAKTLQKQLARAGVARPQEAAAAFVALRDEAAAAGGGPWH